MNSGNTLTFDVDYEGTTLFGTDTPISNMDILIYIDGVYSETLITDVLGEASIDFTTIGEYTYAIMWEGVLSSEVSLDESVSQTLSLEKSSFVFDNDNVFYWEDMSLYSGAIDLYLDGVYVTTRTINNVNGKLSTSLSGMTLGSWAFENQIGAIVIDQSTVSPIVSDVLITPKEDFISKLIIRRGIIIIDN